MGNFCSESSSRTHTMVTLSPSFPGLISLSLPCIHPLKIYHLYLLCCSTCDFPLFPILSSIFVCSCTLQSTRDNHRSHTSRFLSFLTLWIIALFRKAAVFQFCIAEFNNFTMFFFSKKKRNQKMELILNFKFLYTIHFWWVRFNLTFLKKCKPYLDEWLSKLKKK